MSPSKKPMIQCQTCNGYGLVKTEVKLCSSCQGKKCADCPIGQSGFESTGWDECTKCYGAGELEDQDKSKDVKDEKRENINSGFVRNIFNTLFSTS